MTFVGAKHFALQKKNTLNGGRKLEVSWSWPYFFDYMTNGLMLKGVWVTIWLSIISMVIGLALGILAALMKMYGNGLLRYIAEFYIWLFRGTPILIQLVIIYTGLPQLGIRFTVMSHVFWA